MYSLAYFASLAAVLPWASAQPAALASRDQVTFNVKDFSLDGDDGYSFKVSSNRAPGNQFKCTGHQNQPNTQRFFKACEGNGVGYQALVESIPGDKYFLRILYTQQNGDYLEGKREVKLGHHGDKNFSFDPYRPSYEFDISNFSLDTDGDDSYKFEITRHGEPKRGLICKSKIPSGGQIGFSDCKAHGSSSHFVSHFKSSITTSADGDSGYYLIVRWYNSDSDYTESSLDVTAGTPNSFTLPNLYW